MALRLRRWLFEKLARVDRRLARPYGDSYWWESPNLWEPSVRLALLDLCRPGSIVYDVGANFGGLTAVMSRAVGPRGIVCCFEASPRIFPHLQSNIVKQGFHNVTAYHRAVYSCSGELLRIYPGDHLNDSIYDHGYPQGREAALIESVSLDDFSARTDLIPSVIKMDVEGAEFDVLTGSRHLIAAHRPHFILEQQPKDSRCLDSLLQSDYVALDLNSYRLVRSAADYPRHAEIRNVVFVHRTRLNELPYAVPVVLTEVEHLGASDFVAGKGGIESRAVRLSPGRYIVDVRFSCVGKPELMCGVRAGDKTIFRYHGNAELLATSYRDWAFDMLREQEAVFFFNFPADRPRNDPLRVEGADVCRLAGFRPSLEDSVLLP